MSTDLATAVGEHCALFNECVRTGDWAPRDTWGDLRELFTTAGLVEVEEAALAVAVEYAGFEEWWEMSTLGVTPAGLHLAGLTAKGREAVRTRCAERFSELDSSVISESAWAACGRVAYTKRRPEAA